MAIMSPSEIQLAHDRRSLSVKWDDGRVHTLKAADLRRNCRSSRARRQRIDGTEAPVIDGLTIDAIQPIGRYAVNLTFSDGHDRGIFPWSLLRDLADRGN